MKTFEKSFIKIKPLRKASAKETFKESFIKVKLLGKASAKAQSAMEYLMTYGWAILIIAIVLAALFSLGVFNSSSFLGTSCIAGSGFLCSNPVLSGSALTLTLGQYTGENWNTATFCIVPSGFAPPNSMGCPNGYPQYNVGAFSNGQSGTYVFSSTSSYSYPSFGNTFSGTVWAVFTIQGYSGNLTDQVATIIAKNVGASSQSSSSALYVPITIDNGQSAATPSPFQQMIQFSPSSYAQYENSNLGNIRFYQGSTELHSWCESGCSSTASQATFWINLPSGIPANSVVTVNMAFEPTSTNYDGVYAGEAPQLSSTYAQYDDGASVFNNYWNFAGTTLPSSLTETVLSNPSGASGSYSVNNGITISNTNGADIFQSNYMVTLVYSSSTISIPSIVQAQVTSLTGNSGDSGWTKVGIVYQNSITDSSDSNGEADMATTSGNGYVFNYQSGTSYVAPSTGWFGGSISYPTDVSFVFQSTSSVGGFYGSSLGSLTQMGSYVTPTSIASSGYIGLFVTAHSSGTSSGVFQYLLVRAYPPNGVMPSVSFGTVQ